MSERDPIVEVCECCDDPATCHDADGIPLCDGCMKQLIADSDPGDTV